MNAMEKKLAYLVRQHPHLYDQSRRDYKDTVKGHVSWKEIADVMGKSEEEMKQKWKNLRDKFCKAKKRLSRRSGVLPGDDRQPERPVPVLYNQLAWLCTHVKPRVEPDAGEVPEVAGSGDDLEKEQDKNEKEQHSPLPLINNNFSPLEFCRGNQQEMGVSFKRKKQATTDTERSTTDDLSGVRDEDELFLLSLLPSLKRLTIKKRMEVRMKFQQVLYAAEFEV